MYINKAYLPSACTMIHESNRVLTICGQQPLNFMHGHLNTSTPQLIRASNDRSCIDKSPYQWREVQLIRLKDSCPADRWSISRFQPGNDQFSAGRDHKTVITLSTSHKVSSLYSGRYCNGVVLYLSVSSLQNVRMCV